MSQPQHLAIIMDGNGRWARARGRPRTYGHYAGVNAVREAIRGAKDANLQYLTLYSFSTENWRRPDAEIFDLMGLLRRYLRSEIAELHQNNIRLKVIGERERLPADIIELIASSEALTAGNTALTLVLALSYGGRQEIIRAARTLADLAAKGLLGSDAITADSFGAFLQTSGIPDPDIILRTSGEQRLSNFLLWQGAYAELVFIEKYWPDFTASDIADAVAEFQQRERRYGAVQG
jgi:undecaprenyl diphosphate synthase